MVVTSAETEASDTPTTKHHDYQAKSRVHG
jgi:hypothetical protein